MAQRHGLAMFQHSRTAPTMALLFCVFSILLGCQADRTPLDPEVEITPSLTEGWTFAAEGDWVDSEIEITPSFTEGWTFAAEGDWVVSEVEYSIFRVVEGSKMQGVVTH